MYGDFLFFGVLVFFLQTLPLPKNASPSSIFNFELFLAMFWVMLISIGYAKSY